MEDENPTPMDPKLAEAAESGNVDFLREIVAAAAVADASLQEVNSGELDYRNSCFLSQHKETSRHGDEKMVGNIFHLSARKDREEFFREAMQSLPDPLVHLLLSQSDSNGKNPLHVAVEKGCLGIVKLILGFYGPKSDQEADDSETKLAPKPWLALNSGRWTPLHSALSWDEFELKLLKFRREECGLEILKFVDNHDMEALCNTIDAYHNSSLFLAVEHGCNRVAMQILTSAPSYSVSGSAGCTPLHYVTECSEEVCRLLLERHPEMIEAVAIYGGTVIHYWAGAGKLWPLEYVLKSGNDIQIAPEFKRQLFHHIHATDKDGNSPFHIAVTPDYQFHRIRNSYKAAVGKSARTLWKVYKEEIASLKAQDHHPHPPWLVLNKKGYTPLELAVINKNKLLRNEYDRLKLNMIDTKCEHLFLAIQKGLYQLAEEIWHIQHKYGWSAYPLGGREFWHAALKFSDEVAIWVAEKSPSLTSEAGEVVYILRLVSEAGAARFIEWMLKKNPSALKLAQLAWVEACQKGHFLAVMAFIENCSYFRELCLQEKDTPLHHIQFEGYEQYRNFLKNPVVWGLRNFRNCNGETPLHKAIRNKNLLLTEVLLTMDDVIRSIEDKAHETAMDLLVQECKKSQEWDEMCQRNGIIPGLQTTYFQDRTNLLEVRNTLSVVAALLATITFTAGFTLPGGVKSDSTGQATLANKAAFLVFLLADALAMCCSMLVLVCLIWSMVCDPNRSLLLIDRSMQVLLVALYSTLVAFMTGVYVVIPHKSLWAAIVILIMCSIFIITSKRSIMDKLLNKLYPVLNRKYKDKTQIMEQGEATTSRGGVNSQQEKSE